MMKPTVQVVMLNDYEIRTVREVAPFLLKLGRGYRWNHGIGGGLRFEFAIETAAADAIVVKGLFGQVKFRLAVKGARVSFSTEDAERPEFILYNFLHILASTTPALEPILLPDYDTFFETLPVETNDYYIANNEYTERIAEYFQRVLSSRDDLKYLSGMYAVHVVIPEEMLGPEAVNDAKDENAKGRIRIKEFSERSGYDRVALAAVFCRGEGVPFFYANGSIHYLLEKKDFYESIQFDFTRTFMKNSSGIKLEKSGVFTHTSEDEYLRLNPGASPRHFSLRK